MEKGYEEIGEYLIDEGIFVRDEDLLLAAKYGYKEMVKKLLDLRRDVNYKDDYGQTPLDMARKFGHETIARILKSHGGRPGSEIKR